jgi:hypothetical protein
MIVMSFFGIMMILANEINQALFFAPFSDEIRYATLSSGFIRTYKRK